jgi:hypothetical protein
MEPRARAARVMKRVWSVLRRWMYTPEGVVNIPAYW